MVSLAHPPGQLLPPPGSLPDQAHIYHIFFVLYSLLVDFIYITSYNSHNNLVMLVLSSHLIDEGSLKSLRSLPYLDHLLINYIQSYKLFQHISS